VLAEFGRVPRQGEKVTVDVYEFTVDQVARRRIRRLTVHRLEPSASVEVER